MPNKSDITIITPSRVKQDLVSKFPGMLTINPVQTFRSYEDLFKVYFTALLKVKTKFFHFYDDDDIVPTLPEDFSDTGIIFGNNLIFHNEELKEYKNSHWCFRRNIDEPQLIHRAICRTEDAIEILEKVKHLPLVTDWWLYPHLAKDYGFTHVPEMRAYWTKRSTGLHRHMDISKNFTKQLFQEHYPEFF